MDVFFRYIQMRGIGKRQVDDNICSVEERKICRLFLTLVPVL